MSGVSDACPCGMPGLDYDVSWHGGHVEITWDIGFGSHLRLCRGEAVKLLDQLAQALSMEPVRVEEER